MTNWRWNSAKAIISGGDEERPGGDHAPLRGALRAARETGETDGQRLVLRRGDDHQRPQELFRDTTETMAKARRPWPGERRPGRGTITPLPPARLHHGGFPRSRADGAEGLTYQEDAEGGGETGRHHRRQRRIRFPWIVTCDWARSGSAHQHQLEQEVKKSKPRPGTRSWRRPELASVIATSCTALGCWQTIAG